MQVLLATANQGKVRELEEMLNGKDINVLSLTDFPDLPDIEENGETFAENAMIKARTAASFTGLVTLADDSGLEVDALQGAPGVYSARYAGLPKDDERNIDKLLAELQGVSEKERTGRFRCCLAIISPDGTEILTEGSVEGLILGHRKGEGGFGYDPVFYLPELNKTMAELSLEEKNILSHRAQAFRKAVPVLTEILKNEN
ncbi:MAG: XTP/dITP diphosphatase [Peptococcaceae bacterium]|nr:XTP/dITP diphosphatase [Peptococcaceae bacterium]